MSSACAWCGVVPLAGVVSPAAVLQWSVLVLTCKIVLFTGDWKIKRQNLQLFIREFREEFSGRMGLAMHLYYVLYNMHQCCVIVAFVFSLVLFCNPVVIGVLVLFYVVCFVLHTDFISGFFCLP